MLYADAIQLVAYQMYLLSLVLLGYTAKFIRVGEALKCHKIPLLMAVSIGTMATFTVPTVVSMLSACSSNPLCVRACSIVTAVSDGATTSSFGIAQVVRASALTGNGLIQKGVYIFAILPALYPIIDVLWILSEFGIVDPAISTAGYSLANALFPVNSLAIDCFILYAMIRGEYSKRFSRSPRERRKTVTMIVMSYITYILASASVMIDSTLGQSLLGLFFMNNILVFCKVNEFIVASLKLKATVVVLVTEKLPIEKVTVNLSTAATLAVQEQETAGCIEQASTIIEG